MKIEYIKFNSKTNQINSHWSIQSLNIKKVTNELNCWLMEQYYKFGKVQDNQIKIFEMYLCEPFVIFGYSFLF